MIELLTPLGFNPKTPISIFWICTAWTFLAVTVIWFIGLFRTITR